MKDIDKVPVKITTSIPYDAVKIIKENGWKWNDLLLAGLRLRLNNDEFPKRINQLESQIEALKKALSRKEDKLHFRRI
jgi:hypothetical protein